MAKRGYNYKSRLVVKTIVDNSTTKQIQIDLPIDGKYDASNELVLPSKKRKTKIQTDKTKITRILSKKHRKKLEKIVEKKQKKENRGLLLEALSKVQATPEELNQLTSIASVQTKGLKRHFFEENHPKKAEKRLKRDERIVNGEIKLNAISGAKRRQINTTTTEEKTKNAHANNPNVVGFESDHSASESDNSGSDAESTELKKEEKTPDNHQQTIGIADDIKNEAIKGEPKNAAQILEKRKKAVFVDVPRDETIQAERLKLPILAEEQEIMETINENNIIIIAGETGSGKTTQIPQFLYEAGYARTKQIAVTEPRRVAAIAMSHRVAYEMSLTNREISYLIRFEGNATADTKIKFMTDGVLLKEVQTDFLLTKYSVVILDEAHERSVYTDILIGLLSRIVPLREKRGDPLKLIIMSATLRIEDFTTNRRLFKLTPPVINIDSRRFPVTVHFNKRTPDDYIKECFSKVNKIHNKLPDGGILVFVSGQQEVNGLVKKLRRRFPFAAKIDKNNKSEVRNGLKSKKKVILAPELNLDDYDEDEEAIDSDAFGSDSESGDDDSTISRNSAPLWVLPLYSMLSTTKQHRVFEAPPPGARLCIVSTNVAETSLTIPNIKYVVDSGRTKTKLYDRLTGVTSYLVTWTSQASAEQRAGRAGRTSAGHCYRLYSSAVYNDVFVKFARPEIQEKPVDDLFLQMKCMGIDKIVNFPFPSAPDLLQLKTSEKRLEILGALDAKSKKATPLGCAIAKFPVLPRFGKMLALSHQQGLLPYTVLLVAALSVQEVLLEKPLGDEESDVMTRKWRNLRKSWAGHGHSYLLGDAMVLLKAVGAAEYSNFSGKQSLESFCIENGLRYKAVIEIRKLRQQLCNEIKLNLADVDDLIVDPKMAPPNDVQAKLLRQILLAGLGDQLAKKMDEDDGDYDRKLHKFAYRANNMEDLVYLHSGSVFRSCPNDLPKFVVYQEIYETNKIYMRGVTALQPDWLPVYVPNLCQLSEPLRDPEPCYKNGGVWCTQTGTIGSQAWPLPNVEVPFPRNLAYYRWFARFLLEGRVVEGLGKWRGLLLSQAAIMVKDWAKLQSRTEVLLRALAGRGVGSRAELEEVWRSGKGKSFLLHEYLKWLPESAHGQVMAAWPPL